MRALALTVLASAAALLPAGAPAGTAPVSVVSAVAYMFVPGGADLATIPLEVEEGTGLLFVNGDTVGGGHTIRAYDLGPDGRPLFSTGSIVGAFEVAEVHGVETLPPGPYPFYCHRHTGMDGVLTVVPARS